MKRRLPSVAPLRHDDCTVPCPLPRVTRKTNAQDSVLPTLTHNGLGAVHTNTLCGVEVHIDLVDAPP
jgi:hypothetical protein